MRTQFELPPGKPGDVSYSPSERKIFKILSRGRQLTSTELMERFYANEDTKKYHARETLNAWLNSLRDKLAFNRAAITLRKSELRGPYPMSWWLERNK
jgi:hypothetical protein